MADFLSRLAERTLEVAPVAQPIITSLFAKRQTMTSPPSESEGFPEQDEIPAAQDEAPAASEPVTRRPIPRTTPRPPRATHVGNPPYEIPPSPVQPLPPVAESQVSPQPEPPQRAEAERPPAHGESHLLVGPDKVRRAAERHYEAPPQHTPTKKPGEPGAKVSSERESRITDRPVDVVEHREPRVRESLVGSHESLPSPIKEPAGRAVIHDTASVLDVEIVQRAWPGERPRGDVVSGQPERQSERHRLPGSDGAPPQNTGARKREGLVPGQQGLLVPVVQQQEEFSIRQQVEPSFPDKPGGSHSVRKLQPPDAPPHHQGGTTNRRSAESTAEGAATAPTIRVTIGRIDVRAVTPPEPPPRPKPVRSGPTLSLDEYSRQRKGGGR